MGFGWGGSWGVSWVGCGGTCLMVGRTRPNYFRGQRRNCFVHWSFETRFWGMGALTSLCWLVEVYSHLSMRWGAFTSDAFTLWCWPYTDLSGRGVFPRLTSLLYWLIDTEVCNEASMIFVIMRQWLGACSVQIRDDSLLIVTQKMKLIWTAMCKHVFAHLNVRFWQWLFMGMGEGVTY